MDDLKFGDARLVHTTVRSIRIEYGMKKITPQIFYF